MRTEAVGFRPVESVLQLEAFWNQGCESFVHILTSWTEREERPRAVRSPGDSGRNGVMLEPVLSTDIGGFRNPDPKELVPTKLFSY